MEKKKTTKKQCQVCGDSGIMGDGHFSEPMPCKYCERGFMQYVSEQVVREKKQEGMEET